MSFSLHRSGLAGGGAELNHPSLPRSDMFLDVHMIWGRTATAGRRWWITSASFHFGRMCGGRTGCTSKYCPPCGGPTCR